MKRISEKYTYLWTIFSGIPFGIGLLIGAYTTFISISKTSESLIKSNGLIIDYGREEVYHKGVDAIITVYSIQLNADKFRADIGGKIKQFEQYIPEAYLNKKKITIWTEKNSTSIEQLAIDGQIILEYKPPYWQAWTFLIIGLVFTTMGSIYIVKYYKNTWSTE